MKLASTLLLLILTGCNAHQVSYDTTLPRGNTQSEWTGHYLFGSVGHPEINVRRICPQGVAKIETYRSFGNGFVSAITLGIYTPRTVQITCVGKDQVTAIAALSPEGDIRFAYQPNTAQGKNKQQ